MRKRIVERTHRKSESITYEETVIGDEVKRVSERRTSASLYERMLCIESDVMGGPPNGSEIVPAAGPMPTPTGLPPPQIPRLRGDRIDERDA